MPLTNFQKEILTLLAKNRNPNSYIAGGIAINKEASSLRFSKDVDIFHESVEATQNSYTLDSNCLKEEGYKIDLNIQQPAFIRATITKGSHSVKLDWVLDSAYRFFPVIKDKDFGFRLHDVDLATNKCLALAGRSELRDIIDIMQINVKYMSLASCIWAATAKDSGLSPNLIIEQLKRNSKITSALLEVEDLVRKIEPQELKTEWLNLISNAEEKIKNFSAKDLGCVYLDSKFELIKAPEDKDTTKFKKHFAQVGGAWPKIP